MPFVVERRVQTPEQQDLDLARHASGTLQLSQRERQKMDKPDPSRETLADLRQQPELLRTGKNEQPGTPALVHDALQVREKLRATLDFVEQRPFGIKIGRAH